MLGTILPALIGSAISHVTKSPEAGQVVVDAVANSTALTVASASLEVMLGTYVGEYVARKVPTEKQMGVFLGIAKLGDFISAAGKAMHAAMDKQIKQNLKQQKK